MTKLGSFDIDMKTTIFYYSAAHFYFKALGCITGEQTSNKEYQTALHEIINVFYNLLLKMLYIILKKRAARRLFL